MAGKACLRQSPRIEPPPRRLRSHEQTAAIPARRADRLVADVADRDALRPVLAVRADMRFDLERRRHGHCLRFHGGGPRTSPLDNANISILNGNGAVSKTKKARLKGERAGPVLVGGRGIPPTRSARPREGSRFRKSKIGLGWAWFQMALFGVDKDSPAGDRPIRFLPPLLERPIVGA